MSTSARIAIALLILLLGWFVIYWAWIAPDAPDTDGPPLDDITLQPGDTVGRRPAAGEGGSGADGNWLDPANGDARGSRGGRSTTPAITDPQPPGPGGLPLNVNRPDDGDGSGRANPRGSGASGPRPGPGGGSGAGAPVFPTGANDGEEITETETDPIPPAPGGPGDGGGEGGRGGAGGGDTADGDGNDGGGGEGDAAPAGPPPTVPYEVKKGDTMQKIAKQWFGDHDKWVLIAYENPLVDPLKLKAGQTLRLPAKNAEVKDLPAETLAELTRHVDYVVGKNDTLSDIAKQFYGKATLWQIIWDANRDVIPDPARMRAGITIKVPAYQFPAE